MPSHQKIKNTRKRGGEEKTSQFVSTQRSQNASFLFLSTKQMERSDLLEYIKDLEEYVKAYIS